MNRRTSTPRTLFVLFVTALLVAFASGCGDEATAPTQTADGPSDSFGIGKADGPADGYSACQLREVLEVVNESTSTKEHLMEVVGLHAQAAENIVKHRVGPDGTPGTGDDDIFDDLHELDEVSFVGPVALQTISDWASDRCYPNIDERPIIHEETWTGFTGGGWTRDSLEIEATMAVSGVTGQQLRAALAETDDDGDTGFDNVDRHKTMEAFSFDYPLDEIPWGSNAHNLREDFPYVALSIENGRFDIDPDEGDRELDMGTDINDDIYYDTIDYDLLASGVSIRGRVRWDNGDTVRRLLIAAKFNSEVDEEGIKRAGKIDVRTEGGTHVSTLDDDVRSGTVAWNGSRTPIEPIKAAYDELDKNGLLPNIKDKNKVMVLDPKAHIRSLRSRYHLEETELNSLNRVIDNGDERIQLVMEMTQAAIDDGRIADTAAAEQLIADGEALLEGTSVRATAEPDLLALDANTDPMAVPMPREFSSNRPSTQLELDQQEIMARAAVTEYRDFAEALDDIDRDITGTRGLDGDDYVEYFEDWQKSFGGDIRAKKTSLPFLQLYRDLNVDDATRDGAIEALNAFGEQQRADGNDDFEDFEPIDAALWDNLGRHLEYEVLKITKRMIEGAATSGLSLWFDAAREFYVPASSRVTWNFVIDTTDFAQMVTHEEWTSIPEAERGPTHPIPGDKVFHSVLVNEVQLELTEVQEYIDRIDELKTAIANGEDTPENQRLLEGARFVFNTYQQAMQRIAEAKDDEIRDRLEDIGVDDAEWTPALHSKGNTALLILTDKI